MRGFVGGSFRRPRSCSQFQDVFPIAKESMYVVQNPQGWACLRRITYCPGWSMMNGSNTRYSLSPLLKSAQACRASLNAGPAKRMGDAVVVMAESSYGFLQGRICSVNQPLTSRS